MGTDEKDLKDGKFDIDLQHKEFGIQEASKPSAGAVLHFYKLQTVKFWGRQYFVALLGFIFFYISWYHPIMGNSLLGFFINLPFRYYIWIFHFPVAFLYSTVPVLPTVAFINSVLYPFAVSLFDARRSANSQNSAGTSGSRVWDLIVRFLKFLFKWTFSILFGVIGLIYMMWNAYKIQA